MFAKEPESDLPAIAVKIALLLTHRVFMKKRFANLTSGT